MAGDDQGWQVVVGSGEGQLRGLRCAVPLRQRGRPRVDVLRPVPRWLGHRRPRGDPQGAPPLLLLLIRSTLWALTSPPNGEVSPGLRISEATDDPAAEIASVMQFDRDIVDARVARGC